MPEFTYSGDPRDSERDRLRFVIGDTDEAEMLLNDTEVEYILEESKSFEVAVVNALERIVTLLAKEVYSVIGPSHYQAQQKFHQYKELLDEKKRELASVRARPFAGGIKVTDKIARERDGSLTQPTFKRHGWDGGYRAPRP